MKNLWLGGLAAFIWALMMMASNVYADDSQFIQSLHADRARVAAQLGIQWKDNYPWPTSYYDDLADHYEQTWIMDDMIAGRVHW